VRWRTSIFSYRTASILMLTRPQRFVAPGTWAITIGLAAIYAYAPLLMLYVGLSMSTRKRY